jgi:hypothetical protein
MVLVIFCSRMIGVGDFLVKKIGNEMFLVKKIEI